MPGIFLALTPSAGLVGMYNQTQHFMEVLGPSVYTEKCFYSVSHHPASHSLFLNANLKRSEAEFQAHVGYESEESGRGKPISAKDSSSSILPQGGPYQALYQTVPNCTKLLTCMASTNQRYYGQNAHIVEDRLRLPQVRNRLDSWDHSPVPQSRHHSWIVVSSQAWFYVLKLHPYPKVSIISWLPHTAAPSPWKPEERASADVTGKCTLDQQMGPDWGTLFLQDTGRRGTQTGRGCMAIMTEVGGIQLQVHTSWQLLDNTRGGGILALASRTSRE